MNKKTGFFPGPTYYPRPIFISLPLRVPPDHPGNRTDQSEELGRKKTSKKVFFLEELNINIAGPTQTEKNES